MASAYLRLMRPRQWLKNVLVLAAPGAAGVLLEPDAAWRTAVAFVSFCLAASGAYAWNDALDADSDRLHPTKQHRPVASGAVTPAAAKAFGTLLLLAGVAVAFVVRWELAAVVAGYVVLTVAYSLWLKHVAVIDLAAVAAGFVLRMIAGGVAVDVPLSEWFLIVAGAGALFMVTGKRTAEHSTLGDDAAGHRRALAHYSAAYLGWVRAIAAGVAILAYCLWAFERGPEVGDPVWLQVSIVPFVLGILRYALLLDQGHGGAPEDVVLSDLTLQLIGLAWLASVGIAIGLQ